VIVVSGKVEDGVAEDDVGEPGGEGDPLCWLHAKVVLGEVRRQLGGEAMNGLDGSGIRVYCEDFATGLKDIDEVAARPAPDIKDPHAPSNAPAEELVEQVDVDVSELRLQIGH
jgi:hypothetical protein